MAHDKPSGGLEGVVAATTQLSEVDGERGELTIAGFPVGELAAHATFEAAVWLLWHGARPTAPELEHFRAELAANRDLPDAATSLLRASAVAGLDAMDALRIATGAISLVSADAIRLLATMPTMAETRSEPVEMMTRTVKVDAFKPWSMTVLR